MNKVAKYLYFAAIFLAIIITVGVLQATGGLAILVGTMLVPVVGPIIYSISGVALAVCLITAVALAENSER